MMVWRRTVLVVLLSSISFGLLSCSEDDPKVSDVEVEFTPGVPVVINAPFKLIFGTGDEITEFSVEGPWFKSSIRINNNTDSKVVIVGISGTVTAFSASGGLQTSEFEVGVEDLVESAQDDGMDGTNPVVALGIALPRTQGFAAPIRLMDVATGGLNPVAGTSYYIGELPEAEFGEPRISSYNVRVEIQGWFGEFDQANKAFNKIVFFSAR